MKREPLKSVKLPGGVLQKFELKDESAPCVGRFGFGNIVIPFWVFDRFEGEKLQHILLHERGHIRDRYLRVCLLIPWIVGAVIIQLIFNNLIVSVFAFLFTFSWFFENRADKYAANCVGKQAYVETLKDYEVALKQKKGRWAVIAIILEWCLHLPLCIREKLL